MADVCLALLPALVVAVITFGPRALVLTVATVISCVFFEWLYNKLLHKPTSIGDLSAVVTGILLAFNVPVSAPIWMPVIGGAFSVRRHWQELYEPCPGRPRLHDGVLAGLYDHLDPSGR